MRNKFPYQKSSSPPFDINIDIIFENPTKFAAKLIQSHDAYMMDHEVAVF